MQNTNGMNGADVNITLSEEEEDAARDIKQRIAARDPVVDPLAMPDTPFEQKAHTLLLESVDRIALQWVDQLRLVRKNTEAIEQQLMECTAKAKSDLTRMHLLGAQVAKEAQRGQEVCSHLARELEQLMDQVQP
jgi:hypothetical protein